MLAGCLLFLRGIERNLLVLACLSEHRRRTYGEDILEVLKKPRPAKGRRKRRRRKGKGSRGGQDSEKVANK